MEYRRDVFEKGFSEIKKILYKETNNYHTDTYTGKSLIPGGTWDFEHIISAKEFSGLNNIEKIDYEIQSKILNNRKNIGFTERSINKSKSKYDLMEWLNRKSNGRNIDNSEFYLINKVKAEKLRTKTLNFLQSEIDKHCKK
ncbi:hypothetical protein [Polaribacter sp. 11A2H]|uniref:hypothetical protein n=1 Tax=Polaribacter sp. 11A2H TaxID=2687290 RepID=UPI00140E1D18|nr:hypothetical protein [Polaribacter sp. 11A2H]